MFPEDTITTWPDSSEKDNTRSAMGRAGHSSGRDEQKWTTRNDFIRHKIPDCCKSTIRLLTFLIQSIAVHKPIN